LKDEALDIFAWEEAMDLWKDKLRKERMKCLYIYIYVCVCVCVCKWRNNM